MPRRAPHEDVTLVEVRDLVRREAHRWFSLF
jgi:hypothetical protein